MIVLYVEFFFAFRMIVEGFVCLEVVLLGMLDYAVVCIGAKSWFLYDEVGDCGVVELHGFDCVFYLGEVSAGFGVSSFDFGFFTHCRIISGMKYGKAFSGVEGVESFDMKTWRLCSRVSESSTIMRRIQLRLCQLPPNVCFLRLKFFHNFFEHLIRFLHEFVVGVEGDSFCKGIQHCHPSMYQHFFKFFCCV